ncbi:MAG: hypothetical protein AAF950_18105 [Pseudomonadota bacterium]
MADGIRTVESRLSSIDRKDIRDVADIALCIALLFGMKLTVAAIAPVCLWARIRRVFEV